MGRFIERGDSERVHAPLISTMEKQVLRPAVQDLVLLRHSRTTPSTRSQGTRFVSTERVIFGGAMLLRSTGALVSTVVHLSLVDLFIRREEKLLEKEFGDRWIS
jgi:hypothetical protein